MHFINNIYQILLDEPDRLTNYFKLKKYTDDLYYIHIPDIEYTNNDTSKTFKSDKLLSHEFLKG